MTRTLRHADAAGAVQELDPRGKFRSMADVWTWRATRGGRDTDFASCCGPEGFSAACTCAARLDCA